jgi:hypothetical protein
MNDFTEVKANCAILIRGDILAIKRIMQQLDQWLSHEPDIKLIHQQVSASRLWIKEGDDMNERSRKE